MNEDDPAGRLDLQQAEIEGETLTTLFSKIKARIPELVVGREDVRAYKEFVDICLIHPRDVVGFAGAGISRQLNYPTWNELLKSLHQKVETHVRRNRVRGGSLARIKTVVGLKAAAIQAGEYERLLGTQKFRRIVAREFRNRRFQRKTIPDAVARLPFRYIFTTNYDSVLEKTYRSMRGKAVSRLNVIDWSVKNDVDKLLQEWGKNWGRWFIHLHGTAERSSTIVLTEEDYADRYFRSDESSRALLTLLAFRTVVFLGYSLDDIDFLQILREVKALRGSSSRHFAFIGLAENQRSTASARRLEYTLKYGVRPIFYRVGSRRNHFRLAKLLDAVVTAIAADSVVRPLPMSGKAKTKSVRSRIEGKLVDPLIVDDPNRGAFGGVESVGRFKMTARIRKWRSGSKYDLTILVESGDKARPLTGFVTFYLHPTFPVEHRKKRIKANSKGKAWLRFWAYGAFTVGAHLEGENVLLELDLATQRGFPEEFRIN